MKKTMNKLVLLFVIVALLVTGIVLSVSAENAGANGQAVTGSGSDHKNFFFFSGTRTENGKANNLWATPYSANLNTLTADSMTFWPTYVESGTDGEGNPIYTKKDGVSAWVDFEFYYDANVKASVEFRLRSYSGSTSVGHTHFAELSNGSFKWNTMTNGGDGFKLASYGWHHVAFRFTQTTVLDGTTPVDTMTIECYLNGELAASTTAKEEWFTTYKWALYSSVYDAAKPDGIAYSAAETTTRFYFYGNKMFNQNDARLLMFRDFFISFGDTPRVDYAPIKLIGDGVVPIAPDVTVNADENKGTSNTHKQVTHYAEYLNYNVTTWKNFYAPGEESIALPAVSGDGGVIFGGWYADADYTQPITSVSAGESGATAYVRMILPAFEAKSYATGTVYTGNKVASPATALQLGEFAIGPTSGDPAPLWIDFDYYVDPAATNGFEFRLTDTDAFNAGVANGSISSATTWAYKKALFSIGSGVLTLNGTFFPTDATASLGGEGWHHISIKYEQKATCADGALSIEYLFTVYVDGAEALSTKVSNSAAFGDEHHYFLYETSYDATAEKIVYTPNSNLKMYYYSGSMFSAKDERVWMLGDFYATYGAASPFDGYAPIEYNLGGGSLAFSGIDGWSFEDAGSNRFFPFKADGTPMSFATDDELKACTDGSYAAWQYSVISAKHFYTLGEKYVLPEATLAGMDFLGWYTTPDFSGDPITEIPASQVGAVEIYAKFEGRSKVTLNVNGEETYKGKYNFFEIPDTAELWLDSDGSFWTAGEIAELGSDVTFYAVAVSLRDGASIRMDGEHSGIRFEAEIGSALLALLDENGFDYEVGVIITPTDLIAGEFTLEGLVGIKHQILTSSGVSLREEGNRSVLYASLIDILAQNYARAFSARAFVKIAADEEIVVYSGYEAAKNSRSIYEVAKAAYADIPYGYTDEQLAIVRGYIDGVLVLDEELLIRLDQVTAHGYASPYTVSYVDGHLIIKKPAGQTLATILVGTRYIDDWTVSDDGTTVTASFTIDSDDSTVDDDRFGGGFGESFDN